MSQNMSLKCQLPVHPLQCPAFLSATSGGALHTFRNPTLMVLLQCSYIILYTFT